MFCHIISYIAKNLKYINEKRKKRRKPKNRSNYGAENGGVSGFSKEDLML